MKINYLPLWKKISTSKLKLRVIRVWGARTKTPKLEPSVENNEKEGAGRRLQDIINASHLNRKFNLDRRVVHSDRRVNEKSNYNGPSRRYTIDRRLNLKERRDNC